MNQLRIGLDVDGVLANFAQSVIELAGKMGLGHHFPSSWEEIDRWDMGAPRDVFGQVWTNLEKDLNFWRNLPKHDTEVPFIPHCYVTARPVDSRETFYWLSRNGFPIAPVLTVRPNESKVKELKREGVEVFVDDKPENYLELKEAGFKSFLFDRPWNRGLDVGKDRIQNLQEVICHL